MKIETLFSTDCAGAGAMALVAAVALAAACASGGGAPPMTGAEAEALFAELTGAWVLDESASSAPTETGPVPQRVGSGSFTIVKGPGGQGRITGDVAAASVSATVREATYEVWGWRPKMLALQVNGVTLSYRPLPGESIELPMNGGSLTRPVEREIVRTEIFRVVDGLGLEHRVGSQGRVQVVLKVVDGRLEMTRTMRLASDVVLPIVLRYDREEGG